MPQPLHGLQDGYARLGNLSEELKARIQIQFIDEHGLEEAGIDGGGLFKDFMENLIKQAFDPSAGLFNATSDNRLYPNPAAQLGNIDAMPMMVFLGSMLGKCVYEVCSLTHFCDCSTCTWNVVACFLG